MKPIFYVIVILSLFLTGYTVAEQQVTLAPKNRETVNYKVIILIDKIPDGLRWGRTVFADIQVNK